MHCALKGNLSSPPPAHFHFRKFLFIKDMLFSSLAAAKCFNQFSDRFAPVINLFTHLGNVKCIHEICFFPWCQLHELCHLPHNILPGRISFSIDDLIHERTIESAEL